MRESAVFYRSFYEAIKELPTQNQAEVYTAVFEYALNFKVAELSGLSKTIFTLIKPQIDANIKRFRNGVKAKKKQNGSESEVKDKQTQSKSEANNNENVNVNENNNVNENVNVNEKEKDNVNEKEKDKTIEQHPLQHFVKTLTEVSKIKTQLSKADCLSLLTLHGEALVKEILLAMENTKGITNKYTSVYLTVTNWARRRKADIRISDPGAVTIIRPYKPITPEQL